MSAEGGAAKQTLALAAASLAVVIGVATLHKQRSNEETRKTAAPAEQPARKTGVSVGLLRVRVPRDWRDVVKNDVFMDKAIAAVAERLVIYVDGESRYGTVNYMSQLYNLTWDVACLKGKFDLDIRIIAGLAESGGAPSWDDLVRLPDLDAVFADDDSLSAEAFNTLRGSLSAVTYHPLGAHAAPYFRDDLFYFENADTPLEGHSLVMVGGTFDHLHNGHKKLLSLAVSVSASRLLVGITSDEMLRKKKNVHLIESLETRQHNVRAHVSFLKPTLQVEFAVLADAFGPSIVVDDSDAVLVVSTETVAAVPKIREMRAARQLPPLKIFICRRTDASTLSSSFIRDQLAVTHPGK